MTHALRRSLALLTLLCTPIMAQQPATQPADQADLPVRGVTLFSSGVAYFEHAGTVDGDASAALRFKAGQINDLLKSLVLQDLDGGSVRAVTYPSNDPVERQLGSFQVDLSGSPSLAGLLGQLKGARLTLDDNVSGTVVGVETKSVGEGQVKVEKAFLSLFTGSGLKSVATDSIATFTIEDARLREEFARALDVLAGARETDKKSVGLDFTGQGQRRVRLGYVVESPVWKSSYRLLMGDRDEAGSKAGLQGWAIVENQTDFDWNDVNLSLVSGRPISFRMDLYDPLYVQRPVVVPQLYQSLRPQQYAGGIEAERDAQAGDFSDLVAQRRSRFDGRGGGGGGFGGGGGAPAAAAAMPAPMDAAASVQSVADAAELGELFEYKVAGVSIARQSSAMLPVVTDPVEAEPVSIYNPTVLAKHPLNGAIVKNTTGKHLLQGPVTVYAQGGYAGDAQLGDTPPGETRLLSYGVDLKIDAQHEQKPGRTSTLTAALSDGVLTITRKYRSEHSYVFQNETDAARTVVLEHPYDRGYGLVETPEPYETTDALRRFRFDVPADGRETFVVTGETTADEAIRLTEDFSAERLLALSRGGAIPPKVKEALVKAADLQRQVAEASRRVSDLEAQVAEIVAEQDRLRKNMGAVDKSSDYYKRLLNKLDEGETQIEQLQSQLDEARETLEQRRQALRDYLAKLTVG